MEITAKMVKDLRDKTGAGMMDCKKALTEAGGNVAEAEKVLQKMGLAAVAKRSDRATENGRVSVVCNKEGVAVASLACETDFVARNADFAKLGEEICSLILKAKSDKQTPEMETKVQALIAVIKENMSIKKLIYIPLSSGELASYYVHNDGEKVAVVKFSTSDTKPFETSEGQAVLRDVAIHTACFAPAFATKSQVTKEYEAEQKEIFSAQVAKLGKPEKIAQGIVMGKMNSLYSEVVLECQEFYKAENKETVKAVLDAEAKKLGGVAKIENCWYVKAGV